MLSSLFTDFVGPWALTIMDKSLFRKQQCLFEVMFYILEKSHFGKGFWVLAKTELLPNVLSQRW